jgi:hypothetical protein
MYKVLFLTEEDKREVDSPPGEESPRCRQVDKPIEYCCCIRRDVHERQENPERLIWIIFQQSKVLIKGQNVLTDTNTAYRGTPLSVQYVRNLGACPRNASPYKIREEQNKKVSPAEKALVKIPALRTLGRTLILARVIAITNGDWAAFPVSIE